ncbi:hypothetical protein CASFOL_009881 [Castilleja foliolosa]|uniref:H15 domain-containing protein n=1 Tax=Castilleja foliolosa TaxID=1961234 RepID=A0ABD3DSH6_9LAMI
MEKFQNLIFKLAETHPNAPLTPSARTLLQDRLSRFVSQYKTPDHPPYSAMIERAILELNEKRGSSMDSISRFLEKEYDNLPWAHSTMLKHHLQNLCASSFIVMTHSKRYKLPVKIEIPILNSPSKEVNKSKPPRRRKRRKGRPIKLRIQRKGKIVKVIEKHQEHDGKEERLTEENSGPVEQPERQQSEHTWPETSNPSGFEPSNPPGFETSNPPGFETSNPPGFEPSNPTSFELPRVENLPNPGSAELPDEVSLHQQETGLSEIIMADVSAALSQQQPEGKQSEHSQPEIPSFELPWVGNLPNPGSAELPDEVSLHQQETRMPEIRKADVSAAHSQQQPEMQQSEYSQPEIPSFELPCVENLHNPGPLELHSVVNLLHQDTGLLEITKAESRAAHTQEQLVGEQSVNSRPEISKSPNFKMPLTQLEPTSAEELFDSERAHRQLRRWNQTYPGPKLGPKDNHLPLSGDINLEKVQVSVVEKMQSENDVKSVKGVEKYSHRKKTEPKQLEFASSNEKSPSQQPRRSLRLRLASTKVTQDTDSTIMLPSQQYPISEPVSSDPSNSPNRSEQENGPSDITYSRRRKLKPDQSEIIVTDEKEPEQLPEKLPPQRKEVLQNEDQPRRSLRLRSSEPEITVDVNYVIALPSQTCCEDSPKSELSKRKAVNQEWVPEPMKPTDEGTEVKKPTTTLPKKLPRQLKELSQYKEQPRRSLRLRLSEPEISVDANYVNAFPPQTCCEDCPKNELSKEKAVNQK